MEIVYGLKITLKSGQTVEHRMPVNATLTDNEIAELIKGMLESDKFFQVYQGIGFGVRCEEIAAIRVQLIVGANE